MASNYTNLGVQLMTTGEKAGTWGTLTNTNWNIIEQISGGYVSQSIAGGAQTTTLVKSDGSTGATMATRIWNLNGAITGNQIVTVPDSIENWWIIRNATTDGSDTYTVTVQTVSGSGVTFAAGASGRVTKLLYTDGTNVLDASADFGEVTLTGTQTLTNKTLTSPKIGTSLLDVNGLQLALVTATGSAVNEFTIANAAAGAGPTLSATGDESNVDINITPKGTGDVLINPPSTGALIVAGNSGNAGTLTLQADTDDSGSFSASFAPGVLTENTAYTLPLADAGTSGDALTSNASGVLSWTTISGGAAWQAVHTSATLSAVAGNGYFIDTTSNVCNVTLPTGVLGEEVALIDYAGTFDSNTLTVTPASGEKIQGGSADATLTSTVERSAFTLVYSGAAQGWLLKDK